MRQSYRDCLYIACLANEKWKILLTSIIRYTERLNIVRHTTGTLIKFDPQGNQTPPQANYISSCYCKEIFQKFLIYYKHSILLTLKWMLYLLQVHEIDV